MQRLFCKKKQRSMNIHRKSAIFAQNEKHY
jgi:hypothetical protein